jgi:putative AbiEii toxin of type IV toxin-antitoxin system
MRITQLRLANWRNFKNVDVRLVDRVLLFGPNASGKSNLLDSVRFLRDLTTAPGGLQFAVNLRGGVSRLRFLNARRNNMGRVLVAVAVGDDENPRLWEYELHFTREKGVGRPLVVSEIVRRDGQTIYDGSAAPSGDPELATQTAIEQVSLNREFRELADFLSGVEYLHLVPQIVRDPTRGGSSRHDPFGGTFLSDVGQCPKAEYERRRRVMESALKLAVPQFESINRVQDSSGTWHLEARYKHFRPNASAQDERDFSDGTLRLIGLLWALSDRGEPRAPVLLEEPELSLHAEILKVLPGLLSRAVVSSHRQVIASSHGSVMLEDPGLSPDEVLLLIPGTEGTNAKLASSDPMVVELVASGAFTVGEAVRADLVLPEIEQLMSLKMT